MPDRFQEKVRKASDEELRRILALSNHDSPNWRCIFDEIQLRGINQIGKVHWFQHVANVAAVIAAIAGIVSIWLMWPQDNQPFFTEATPVEKATSTTPTDKQK
jgi:hypothetical protein